ncbi:MAG: hypothetical protein ACJAS4_000025 [Bacteriovoracaceae bacterium]|jgi:hypothetical protein
MVCTAYLLKSLVKRAANIGICLVLESDIEIKIEVGEEMLLNWRSSLCHIAKKWATICEIYKIDKILI